MSKAMTVNVLAFIFQTLFRAIRMIGKITYIVIMAISVLIARSFIRLF
ncbi:MAG: hypothetical protein HC844_15980 [Tabrizicola sp.]|nr:hypothetical protein [Tabrizicola sp.]